MNPYAGYTIKIITPSISLFPESAIREELLDYAGAEIIVSEAPGRALPYLSQITFPEGVDLGRTFIDGVEVPGFGQQAAAMGVAAKLAKLKPTT